MIAAWDSRALRYRNTANGRFIKRQAVADAVEGAVTETAERMRATAIQLQNGQINLAQFELTMRDLIKAQHLLSAGIAQGGKAQLSPAALGRIGADTKKQYQYLANLGRQIERGEQPLNGQFLARVELYARASRQTFMVTERRAHLESGFDEERNMLHPAEHCEGCIAEDAKGWVPIGELVPVGQRTCKVNDRCTVEYRKAA